MPLYRLTLAYDGTEFAGWQVQSARGSSRTVQGAIESALGTLAGGACVRVAAAGRTDSGVHALGQVVSFDFPRELAPSALTRALNGILPRDLRVVEAGLAPPGFHARRSALSKLYRYVLDTGPTALPLRRRIAGHVPWLLDEAPMQEVAALYRGRWDFASLASAGSSVKTTVREVTRSALRVEPTPDLAGAVTIVYEVEADGFLRRMVRSMVGGLVAAGRGVITPQALGDALRARDRRLWPAPAEARGLTLVWVRYADRPVLP